MCYMFLKRLLTAGFSCMQYEPVIEELRRKHESMIKERMLVNLKNDRLEHQVTQLKNAAVQSASQLSPRRSMLMAAQQAPPPAGLKGASEGSHCPWSCRATSGHGQEYDCGCPWLGHAA